MNIKHLLDNLKQLCPSLGRFFQSLVNETKKKFCFRLSRQPEFVLRWCKGWCIAIEEGRDEVLRRRNQQRLQARIYIHAHTNEIL